MLGGHIRMTHLAMLHAVFQMCDAFIHMRVGHCLSAGFSVRQSLGAVLGRHIRMAHFVFNCLLSMCYRFRLVPGMFGCIGYSYNPNEPVSNATAKLEFFMIFLLTRI